MDAIETLMNEHRLIERVLDGMVAFAEEVGRRGTTEKEELARFVTFVREYADAHHHAKEENVLFRAMVDHGFPRDGGPIAVMLHEHDEGRSLVSTLAQRARQDAPWSDGDRQEIADVARAFSDLLHAHIHKEDAMEAVSAECEQLEEAGAAAGTQARLTGLGDELVQRHASAVHPSERRTPRLGCFG